MLRRALLATRGLRRSHGARRSAWHGVYPALGAAPFVVEADPYGCGIPSQGACGLAADGYGLIFRAKTTGASLKLNMGKQVVKPLLEPASKLPEDLYRVRNLRSYSTGSCENDSHWGWWVFAEAWAT